jgi:hypothetical protein
MRYFVCCGMLRSGSTLQYQIATELVERKGLGKGGGFLTTAESEKSLARRDTCELLVVKVHDWTASLHALLTRGEAAGVYSIRDLRDVAASIVQKFDASTEALFVDWLPRIARNDALWRKAPNVLITRYEDFIVDISQLIILIARLLGVPLSANETVELANELSIENQKARMKNPTVPVSIGAYTFDQKTLLHTNHILDGRVGRWNEVLEPNVIAEINVRYSAWLGENGYST